MSEVSAQRKDGVLVVQFARPKILSDAIIQQIGCELLELVDKADGKILVNLQDVIFMSSSMIGRIVLFRKRCKGSGTEIKFCNVHPKVMEVFEITRLNKVFDIHDALDDALDAFAG